MNANEIALDASRTRKKTKDIKIKFYFALKRSALNRLDESTSAAFYQQTLAARNKTKTMIVALILRDVKQFK